MYNIFIASQVPFPTTVTDFFIQFFGSAGAAHPLIQFLKYAFAGGISTAVHIVVFFIFGWLIFPCIKKDDALALILRIVPRAVKETARARNAVYSNVIAFTVSNAVCYMINRVFVFEPGRHGVFVEIAMFYAVSGIAVFLGTVVMHKLIAKWGVQTSVAFCANLFFSIVFNFVLRKFLIFNG